MMCELYNIYVYYNIIMYVNGRYGASLSTNVMLLSTHIIYYIRKYTRHNIIITHPNLNYVNIIVIYCPDRIIIVPLCFIRACVFRVTVS